MTENLINIIFEMQKKESKMDLFNSLLLELIALFVQLFEIFLMNEFEGMEVKNNFLTNEIIFVFTGLGIRKNLKKEKI